ncbi:MAG: thymidylate kinase, partial [Methanomassiliicoccales archaeon]|nr:thymidylate kinase [Methanomassiliicoccales archaeon]
MRWIVVDGIDGSGKTTHANWIREYYERRGESTEIYLHPSSRLIGRLSRKSLQGSGKAMQVLAGTFFILDVLNSLRIMRHQVGKYDNIVFVRYIMATAYLPSWLAMT